MAPKPLERRPPCRPPQAGAFSSLEAEADRLAALRSDSRTPGVVRRAFLRPSALTPRRFLALEEAASPLLSGQWPTEDPDAMAQAFIVAWAIVFPDRPLPAPGDVTFAEALAALDAEVAQALSTVMPMRFPRPSGHPPRHDPPDHLGWFVRFLARFPYPPQTVLDTPLDQLFALSAALSANEGAEAAGQDYRERESATGVVLGPVDSQPDQKNENPEHWEEKGDGRKEEEPDHGGTVA